MYWTPCARLMKSITPKTSVSPAAIRKRMMPSCSPFRVCTAISVVYMGVTRHALGGSWARAWQIIEATRIPARPAAAEPEGAAAARSRSLHGAELGIDVAVILEDGLDVFRLEQTVLALVHLRQNEVLDRVLVGVEGEFTAQRGEIGVAQGFTDRLEIGKIPVERGDRRIEQHGRVIGLHGRSEE